MQRQSSVGMILSDTLGREQLPKQWEIFQIRREAVKQIAFTVERRLTWRNSLKYNQLRAIANNSYLSTMDGAVRYYLTNCLIKVF
ncbi:hypothetical protein D9M70_569740 [compost metagenome]